jgi:hypothetical protein
MARSGVGQNAILPFMDIEMDAEPVYQKESFPESPAIHVAVLPDADPAAFRWVMVGAEEEGVPCREVLAEAESVGAGRDDPRVMAWAAARASRLGVGIAASRSRLVLHETHMPVERPVWELPLGGDLRPACRLVGCNAGRMVKRMPLRFEQESTLYGSDEIQSRAFGGVIGASPSEMMAPGTAGAETQADAADLAAIVVRIVRALQGRGIV